MTLRTLRLVLGLALFLLLPRAAFAASVYLDPESGTYGPGDTFISTVRIDAGGDCINAADISITYPKESLRAVDFSRGDSILSLWAVEPHIDTALGTVTFAGGIPGGYCGRITGDAALSNVLGKIVFTVIGANAPIASIDFSSATTLYLNDGQGTPVQLTKRGAAVTLSKVPTLSQNPWLAEVSNDTTPPQPFSVDVESTSGVYGGKYYIVFSTSDKESGIDHFEIFEHGGWKRVTSPYVLGNQSLLGVGDIQVRAVDKAGNVRLGVYSASSTPQRQYSSDDYSVFIVLGLIVLLVGIKARFDYVKEHSGTPSA